MKFAIIALIGLSLLTGCTEGLSSAKPDVVNYTRSVQRQAADEIESKACPVLGDIFMPDYSVLRDQVREL